jgi:glycosyltransferase involved in cell wall biosynthesis
MSAPPLSVPSPVPSVDVLVSTYNSAATLRDCLASARRFLPVHRLIVVDRRSTDGTDAIAREFGAEVHSEDVGLGYSRSLALGLAETEKVLFLDSDVTIDRADFWPRALEAFRAPRTGAVVGNAVGHPFAYGLPLGLTVLPLAWARRVVVPPDAQGRETYYFQKVMRRDRLRVRYVADAMHHRSQYRGRYWPEWQGAQTRIAAGWSAREVAYSALVVLLLHVNSRRVSNVAYAPVFFLKFLRGYFAPQRWRNLDRRPGPSPGAGGPAAHSP